MHFADLTALLLNMKCQFSIDTQFINYLNILKSEIKYKINIMLKFIICIYILNKKKFYALYIYISLQLKISWIMIRLATIFDLSYTHPFKIIFYHYDVFLSLVQMMKKMQHDTEKLF